MSATVNERGNTISTAFYQDRDRIFYDLAECRTADGWHQYATDQDAIYFGVWIHPGQREIVTWAEGDEIRITCPDVDSYRAELAHLASFYGPAPAAFVSLDHDGTVTRHYTKRPE